MLQLNSFLEAIFHTMRQETDRFIASRFYEAERLASMMRYFNRGWRRTLYVKLLRAAQRLAGLGHFKLVQRHADMISLILLFDDKAPWPEIQQALGRLTDPLDFSLYAATTVSLFWIDGRFEDARNACQVWYDSMLSYLPSRQIPEQYLPTREGEILRMRNRSYGREYRLYKAYLEARSAMLILEWSARLGDVPARQVALTLQDQRDWNFGTRWPGYKIPFGEALAVKLGIEREKFKRDLVRN